LLIGINYTGTSHALNGCVNDVADLRRVLQDQLQFDAREIRTLTDANEVPALKLPTRAAIEGALEQLVVDVEEQGVTELWISYSGHGTNVRDRSGDESDGKDEAIVPLDYATAGVITDDHWRSYMARLPQTCRVFCLFDSCHSGTMADLPNAYRYVQTPATRKRVTKTFRRWYRGRMRVFRHSVWRTVPGTWKWQATETPTTSTTALPALACSMMTISGCRDPQTSADVYNAQQKQWTGAMSAAFAALIRDAKEALTCTTLCQKLNTTMADKDYTQRPVLCSTRPIEESTLFYNPRPPFVGR
jgi:hypothetical protein